MTLRLGDIVKFYGGRAFKSVESRYASPGIVIDTLSAGAVIYWCDGRITNEYESYLEIIDENQRKK